MAAAAAQRRRRWSRLRRRPPIIGGGVAVTVYQTSRSSMLVVVRLQPSPLVGVSRRCRRGSQPPSAPGTASPRSADRAFPGGGCARRATGTPSRRTAGGIAPCTCVQRPRSTRARGPGCARRSQVCTPRRSAGKIRQSRYIRETLPLGCQTMGMGSRGRLPQTHP